MDIGAEISKKIQMAITAKLKELDAYVDDELPDYIMIMVANKKTESQMTEALSLFLSENTTIFTSWLHNLLAHLRKAKSDHIEQGLRTDDKTETMLDVSKITEIDDSSNVIFKSPAQNEKDTSNTMDPTTKRDYEKVKSSEKNQFEESASAEAIITINAESDDVLDEELRNDTTPLTFANSADEANNVKFMKINQQVPNKVNQTTSVLSTGKMIRSETKNRNSTGTRSESKSNSRSNSYNRKSHYRYRRSPPLAHNKSKMSKEINTQSEVHHKATSSGKNDVEKCKRLESKPFSHPGSIPMEYSEQPVVREWDRGKGRNGNEIISDRGKKRPKKYEEWVESSDEDKNYSKAAVNSTVNAVAQVPEFISDNSGDDDDIRSAITSKISFPERKMRVPLGKQANKALLIRAVSEAEKSVRRKRSTVADEKEIEGQVMRKREKYKHDSSENEYNGKPMKISRKCSQRLNHGGRKFMIHRVIDSPSHQEREADLKGMKKGKKLILVRKNPHDKHKKQISQSEGVARNKLISSKASKVILLEEKAGDQPVAVILKKRSRSEQEIIYVGDSTSDDESYLHFSTKDKRNFISRDNQNPKLEIEAKTISAVVKFDSRQAQPTSDLLGKPTAVKKKKATAKVSPRPQITQRLNQMNSATKFGISEAQSPKFIVTLDGVTSKKSDTGFSKDKVPELVSKNFKFEPVVPPSATQVQPSFKNTVSTTPEKPIILEDTDDTAKEDNEEMAIPASNTAIKKMREKLLKVQEEAAKLKRMQAKLAAAQAQQNAIMKSGGMYADSVETEQKSIFIGNVHYSTTVKQLSDYFSICGNINRVTILKDVYTGHPKGFAYLEFGDKRSVSSALALDNTRLNNRVIRVTLKSNQPVEGVVRPAKRALYSRPREKFLGGSRFSFSAKQYSSQIVKFPSRNKTWINPSRNILKK